MLKHPKFHQQHHPHLLSVNDKFEKNWWEADVKMMIFGISTNGWGMKDNIYDFTSEKAVSYLMKQYEEFYFEKGNWKYGHAFWNYFYAIEEILKYRLHTEKVSTIWNNLYKVHLDTWELEEEFFNLTCEEIKIFQPDIILLLGLGERWVFGSRLTENRVEYENYAKYDDTENELLYYSLDTALLERLPDSVKSLIITYHPNARGTGGIKLKLMLDQLLPELSKIVHKK